MERHDSIQDKLKDLRVGQRGGPHYTLEELSAATGISKSALGKYESDDCTDISPYNLAILARFYGVSVDYLLGLTEQKNHPGAAIEGLHLSDAMLELLKSGKINNHLLCEMAMHPDFQRLMVDIEIYVDRIADMRIRDMNAYLDAVRETLVEQYAPGNNDLGVRTLELAHIHADEYFQHTVHEDLDKIIADIRNAHADDKYTAPEDSGAEQAKAALEEAMSIEGSEQEQQAIYFCKQLGINYRKLSHEEFVSLVSILKKSKLLQSGISQRGKTRSKRKKK
ncbi:MAG: helix-turn-helix transcriptional regulator [Clostridiales bacterium]|nr:helix-turn-helix transcriptional regulator [Clostridiales bacterium]